MNARWNWLRIFFGQAYLPGICHAFQPNFPGAQCTWLICTADTCAEQTDEWLGELGSDLQGPMDSCCFFLVATIFWATSGQGDKRNQCKSVYKPRNVAEDGSCPCNLWESNSWCLVGHLAPSISATLPRPASSSSPCTLAKYGHASKLANGWQKDHVGLPAILLVRAALGPCLPFVFFLVAA